jgi:hypothetical protein
MNELGNQQRIRSAGDQLLSVELLDRAASKISQTGSDRSFHFDARRRVSFDVCSTITENASRRGKSLKSEAELLGHIYEG